MIVRSMNRLSRRIERLRRKMIRQAQEKGLLDSEVLKTSKELDSLLNKYYQTLH